MMKLNILIVEDEPIVAMEIKHRLEKMGHNICGLAAFGEKAIELASQTTPNLALMDIKLKGKMNGIEAAITIGEKYFIPSIFITAFSDDRTLTKIRETTNYEYLLKPFNEKDLAGAIERTINNQKSTYSC